MAKTYIDVVKYMVEARFDVAGLAEKPDIIGAVFGQTEGLLGGGLDLRELQKNGKIGRIEIEVATSGNKTYGKLFLPSSLGRVETCILGATIESVDRVGPFETAFKVNKIEDTRNEKRRKILTRAKELLKTLLTTEIPDSKEISELVESEVKSSVVTSYGPENLSAGPDIDSSDEIILVEGRADVINLLKNDINNCIAVGGATGVIPKTIIDLTKSKDTTLFTDGDRGGDMILRGLSNVCEIDFVVRAPDGKEVEELTRKDIIKALRARIPIEQALSRLRSESERGRHFRPASRFEPRPAPQEMRQQPQVQTQPQPQPQPQQQFQPRSQPQPRQQAEVPNTQTAAQQRRDQMPPSPSEISKNMLNRDGDPKSAREQLTYKNMLEEVSASSGIKDMEGNVVEFAAERPVRPPQGQDSPLPKPQERYINALSELHNTLRGRIYDGTGAVVAEAPIRELIQKIEDTGNASVIVFDGIITQRLIELANRHGAREIYGVRAGQISRSFDGMLLYTKEQGLIGQ
jgi:DNA primase